MREDTHAHTRAHTRARTRARARTHTHTHMQVGTDSRTSDSNDDGARRDEGTQPYQLSGMLMIVGLFYLSSRSVLTLANS